MRNNLNTNQALPIGNIPPTQDTLRFRLESVRKTIRHTQRAVQVNEGRLLDHETAEGLWRMLQSAVKGLEEITLSVVILERKGVRG